MSCNTPEYDRITPMDLEKIKEGRPYLAGPLSLYERFSDFKDKVCTLVGPETCHDGKSYPPELINPVFNAFSSSFEIPDESLAALKDAMLSGGFDLSGLPSGMNSATDTFSENESADLIFLISKPYFLWLKRSGRMNKVFWTGGRCPVCKSIPSLASIDADGKRELYCSFCETSGYFNRLGCPVCLNSETSRINIIEAEDEAGFRVEACDSCGSYIKSITSPELLNKYPFDLADIVSLPLDIVAQKKGYRRNSPNTLGMTKML